MDESRRAFLLKLWERHIETEFAEKSAQAAVDTMVPHATVNHVPTMTGGSGTDALLAFYGRHFIPRMPADTRTEPINRTVGVTGDGHECIVDEFLFSFTHDCQMDWMLPGLAPTGRKVSVPFVVVVRFEGDLLCAERIYWDQATVLLQLGLLPRSLACCVTGSDQAAKAKDQASLESNQLIHAAEEAGR